MKKTLIAAALIAGGAVALQGNSYGHGGTYRGPGDTVPAGGGGTSGGGPATPGSGGPTTPGPAGPTTPGAGTPGAPGGAPGAPNKPTTSGGGDQGPDLTVWQFWWGFNREPYLNLKAAIHSGAVATGSDEFFLGKGEKDDARDTLRPSEEKIRGLIVPALLQSLKTERNKHIVTGCMVALAKIGDANSDSGASSLAEEFVKFLSEGDQEIRETAALSLGILATESNDNISILTNLLQNDINRLRSPANEKYKVLLTSNVDIRSRAFAAYGLGLIGNRSSKPENQSTIVSTLAKVVDGSEKFAQRDVPVACVVSMGLIPMPIDDAAMAAPVDLKDIGKKPRNAEIKTRLDQVLWLMSYYADENQDFMVRAHVPRAIAQLLSDVPMASAKSLKTAVAKRFLEDITKLSKERDEIKQSCIIALGQLGDCDKDEIDVEIRKGLVEAKELANEMAKNFALIALGQASGRPGDGEDPVAGLSEGKKGARSFLQEQLAKGKSNTKAWSALALGVMERSLADAKQQTSSDVRSEVRRALKESKTPMEVGAYAVSVGIMQDGDSKDALREKLDSITDDDARGYTAIGLGLVNDRSSIEAIQGLITKSRYKPDLLKSAAIGLGLLGDKTLVDSLVAMLAEAQGLSSQAAISSALGFIGDARSVEPLIQMLQDKQKTENARGFAAAALGIVADKEALPWNSKISVNINYRANTTTLTSPSDGTGILDIL
ncbi:MAG: HEAT repeat domain-containing protein [Planctomycetes bacterium]|nr:HEAT repeat domain-containing protein [Planctomycetota bacterium]